MKKLLSIALVFAMILTVAVTAMAAPKGESTELTWTDGFGFHCGECGGNGATAVEYTGSNAAVIKAIAGIKKQPTGSMVVEKGEQKNIFGTKTFPITLERVDMTTTWNLMTEDIKCATCGRTDWITFSNNNGVINGKNIQAHHPEKKEEPPANPLGELSILKTVNDAPFAEWAADMGLTVDEQIATLEGMKFTAYLLDGEDGARTGKSYVGEPITLELNSLGTFTFGDVETGWYEVVEEVSGAALTYFVDEGRTQVYYVGEGGVESEVTSWVSGQDNIGTIVSHNGIGVNWELPKVWNDRLAGQPAFEKLMAMNAQWVWSMENTYPLGISGGTYTETFKVTLGEAITVPLLFAADNVALIYVNGVLAAYTDVALKDRGVALGDAYDANVLGTLKFDKFDGRWNEGWAYAYEKTIDLTAGENEIIIIAANSASTNPEFTGLPATSTDNDNYNLENNPCGVIFGFEIPAVTFNNTSSYNPYSEVTVSADIEMLKTLQYYTPSYIRLTESNSTDTLVSKLNHDYNGNADAVPNSGQVCVLLTEDAYTEEGMTVEVATSGGKYGKENFNPGIGYYYNIKVVDDEIVVTFPNLVYAYAGIEASADFSNFGNGMPNVKALLTETGNTLSITLPESETVYLYLHIAGGLEWYTGESILDENGWTPCCTDTVACTVCEAPVLTAKVYDADGVLVKEAALEASLLGDDLTAEIVFLPSEYGTYTVKLCNGEDVLKEEEITVGNEAVSVGFGTISIDCGETEDIKDETHVCSED